MVRILLWLIALLFFGTYRIPGPSVFPENRSDPVPDDGDVYIAPAFGEDSSCMQSVGEACFPVFVVSGCGVSVEYGRKRGTGRMAFYR